MCMPTKEDKTDQITLDEFHKELRLLLGRLGRNGFKANYVRVDWIETTSVGEKSYIPLELEYEVKD